MSSRLLISGSSASASCLNAVLAALKSSARWRKSSTGFADFCSWYRSTRSFASLRKAGFVGRPILFLIRG